MYALIRRPEHARPPSRRLGRAWLLCLAAGWLLASAAGDTPLPRAEGEESPPARGQPTMNEIEVTMRVRQALSNDPDLKSLNVFVRVQAGRATLNGPVPSVELLRKAEKTVREVRGVYEVANRLQVVAPEEKPFEIPLNPEPTIKTESARPILRPNLPTTLAGRTPAEPADGQETGTVPFPDAKPANPAPGANLGGGVSLLPPVVAPNPAPVADPVETVRAWVNWLRQEDGRYRVIAVEVRDAQTLWVYDDPYRGDDVAALAARLRRIPGIRTVLIKNPSPRR